MATPFARLRSRLPRSGAWMRAVLLASRAALCTARLRARRGSASARARASPATAAHRAMHAASAASGAPATLNASLHAGRAALAGRGPLTLVLGNEAADMDSIACAVAFAALLRACGDDGAVAFVGVPREDLRLRAEVAWLLQRERVDVDAVVFADDAELGALRAAGRLRRVVLVGAGAIHSRRVDAAAHACASPPRAQTTTDRPGRWRAPSETRWRKSWTITWTKACTAPLCATSSSSAPAQRSWCVFRERLQRPARSRGGASQAEHISREAPALLDDAALRTMLLGAVLLDTGNLTGISVRFTVRGACDGSREGLRRGVAQGRVTPQDKEAVKLLSRGASEEDIRVLFETLRFKRTDQSGLSTPDLLRRCVTRLCRCHEPR